MQTWGEHANSTQKVYILSLEMGQEEERRRYFVQQWALKLFLSPEAFIVHYVDSDLNPLPEHTNISV